MESRVITGYTAPLAGTLAVPADKSITHRALIFGSISSGPVRIHNALNSEDCQATAECLRRLGAKVEWENGEVVVTPGSWPTDRVELDCANSGTTARLLAGLVAGRDVEATLVGDASLSRRPMRRVVTPLTQMGAELSGETLPLQIKGKLGLNPIDYSSEIASAQVKSSVLIAALSAQGTSTYQEPYISRDHTERMFAFAGVDIRHQNGKILVNPKEALDPVEWRVPGDPSSAAFWIVAALCLPGSEITLTNVGLNPTRSEFLEIAMQTGADIQIEVTHRDPEHIGAVHVRYTENKRPLTVQERQVPACIDELPILAVLATQCEGESRISGAGELRVKESDRIGDLAAGLHQMGADIEPMEDGMVICGANRLHGAHVDAKGDHRLAMSFAIAALLAHGDTKLHNADSVSVSYPDFYKDMETLLGD